jgi:hypothetical protein
LRPGEPGYSGPAEEFGEEPDFVSAEATAEPETVEPMPPLSQEPASREPQPAATQAAPPRKETPSQPTPSDNEAERTPIAYNVPPPQEVSGPAPNPRRGWWRR